MFFNIPFVTQEEEPTMAQPSGPVQVNLPTIPPPKLSEKRGKQTKQLTLFGLPATPSTKTIKVSAFKKKNGSLVPAHTRHIKAKKRNKKKKPATTPPPTLDPSVALALKLQKEEWDRFKP